MRESVLKVIEKEKIIIILRGIESKKLIPLQRLCIKAESGFWR